MKIIPKYTNQKYEYTFFEKIKYTLISFLSAYSFIFLFKLLIEFLNLTLNHFGLKAVEIVKISDVFLNNKSNFKIAFNLLIFAPIIEEVMFRLHLNLKNNNFTISLLLLFVFTTRSFFKPIVNLEFYFLSIYSLYLIYIYYVSNKYPNLFYETYKINYTFSTFIFGLFHIINLKSFNNSPLSVFVGIVPMLIFGYYFSKIRMKYNILWSIILHSLSNLFPCLLIIFSK